MKLGIWKRAIKYFPHGSVMTWLRSADAVTSFGSRSWKNIWNTLPVILQWMAWKSSSGHSISIGKDVILGLGHGSFLSQEMVNILNQRKIHLLYQARWVLLRGSIGSIWISSDELGLVEDLTVEWDRYRQNLIDSGIF